MNDIIVSETGSFPLLRFALNQLLGSSFASQLHRSERVIIHRLASGVYEEGVALPDREYWLVRETLIRWEATQPGKKVEDLHFQREKAGASVRNVLSRTKCFALTDRAGAAVGLSGTAAEDACTKWVSERFFTLSLISLVSMKTNFLNMEGDISKNKAPTCGWCLLLFFLILALYNMMR